MRETAPVLHDEVSGSWHVFWYDDVQRVLSEHATFSSRMGGDAPSETGQLFVASLITTDPPRHRQLRSLVTQAFTPKAVDGLAPRISALTEKLLAGIAAMGIRARDRDRFKQWPDVIVSQTRAGAENADHRATNRDMTEYFLAMIEQRRRRPGNDLISNLLAAEIEGQKLSVAGGVDRLSEPRRAAIPAT